MEIWDLSNGKDIGTPPPSRYGHSSIILDEKIFIFGGCDSHSGKVLSSLVIFDIKTGKWLNFSRTPKNENFSRSFHTSVFSILHNSIYVFGGKSNGYKNSILEIKFLSKFSSLDFSKNTHSQITFKLISSKDMKGDIPSPRYGHSSFVQDSQIMFIFGGYDNNGFTHNTLHSYEFSGKIWKKILIKNNAIPRRFHHCAVMVDDKYYVINGLQKNNTVLDDVWMIDVKKMIVKEVKLKKNNESSSFGSICFVLDGKIYCYGGRTCKKNVKRMSSLEIVNQKESESIIGEWKSVQFPFNSKLLLSYCSINVYKSRIYFFGGQNKEKEEREKLKKRRDKDSNIIDMLPIDTMKIILSYIHNIFTFNSILNTSKSSHFVKTTKEYIKNSKIYEKLYEMITFNYVWEEKYNKNLKKYDKAKKVRQETIYPKCQPKLFIEKWNNNSTTMKEKVIMHLCRYKKIKNLLQKFGERVHTYGLKCIKFDYNEEKHGTSINNVEFTINCNVFTNDDDGHSMMFCERKSYMVSEKSFKCTVIGSDDCGKSTLVRSFFKRNPCVSKFAKWFTLLECTSLVVYDNQCYRIKINDTPHSEDYQLKDHMLSLQYPETDVFLVCYDVTKRCSFEKVLVDHIEDAKRTSKDAKIILCATKVDKRFDKLYYESNKDVIDEYNHRNDNKKKGKKRVVERYFVSEKEGIKAAKLIGAKAFIEVSSLYYHNVSKLGHLILWAAMDKKSEKNNEKCIVM